MTENCKEIIKALGRVADEENIYSKVKKSAFEQGLDIVDPLGDDSALDILDILGDEFPKRMSYVLSNKLSKKQSLQLANQVTKELNVDSDKVAGIILKDRQMKTLALSALEAFIKNHTNFTFEPPKDTCCIL